MKKKLALVIGSKSVNATGLIRSLGQEGFKVIFATWYTKIESHWCDEYVALPENHAARLKVLLDYLRGLPEKPAVFPTDDEMACWIDEHYKELINFCHVPHAHGTLKKLADKNFQNSLAAKSGLAVISSQVLDLDNQHLCIENYPVIIKPLSGILGHKGDIKICHDYDEFCQAVQALRLKGYHKVLIQDFLHEPDQYEIGVMGMALPDGTVELPAVIRKIRSYPIERGSTSYAQVKHDFGSINKDILKHFVQKTGYVGLFDIELIYARKQYFFIEINFRNGQYGYALTAFGWNLPARWAEFMLEGRLLPEPVCREVYYMNEREDFQHVKEGRLSLKQWWKQFRMAKAYGLFCPGDQRPFVRQFIKIPDRILMWIDKKKKRINDLLYREEWVLAYRKKGDSLLFEKNGREGSFWVIRDTWRYWFADPFLFTWKDEDYIFCEMYDRLQGKGVIGCAQLVENRKITFKIAYEVPHHLSFPYVFSQNNHIYMLPESSYGKNLCQLKAAYFPNQWETEKKWFAGQTLVDSVIFNIDQQDYLMTQKRGDESLLLFYMKDKNWKEADCNPIVENKAYSRLGGALFQHKGDWIRVAQDCSEEYGKLLHFFRVNQCTAKVYNESEIADIDIQDIKFFSAEKYEGVHTYNVGNTFEIIDLKLPRKLKVGNLLNLVFRLFRKCIGRIVKTS